MSTSLGSSGVEQRTEDPCVVGSIPTQGTVKQNPVRKLETNNPDQQDNQGVHVTCDLVKSLCRGFDSHSRHR